MTEEIFSKTKAILAEWKKGSAVDSLVIDLDKFHYHELSDRCHIINSMIDDFILSHPACSVLMNSYAVNAQSLICAVMTEAAKEGEKLGR